MQSLIKACASGAVNIRMIGSVPSADRNWQRSSLRQIRVVPYAVDRICVRGGRVLANVQERAERGGQDKQALRLWCLIESWRRLYQPGCSRPLFPTSTSALA
jgi:hypothetical protein